MVEELSGVTHAQRIKVRRGEDKIQTDTVDLTFDSPRPPSRIPPALDASTPSSPEGIALPYGVPSFPLQISIYLQIPRNIRGFRSNFEELKLLLNRLQSAVVALEECRLGEEQLPPRSYSLLLPQYGSSGGEAALLIRNGTRFF
ncbi:hypothetical protein PoB_004132800 [Plakobranchus ocellatus]|uniref:Uncharacterized protein n=1 Tax=Plakobranchus ocellatus TaxID=259542 RepID=A0AAV4B6S1_9GAST|nr:hypothetical protein PoB_004132800 [Plakobranchus ocellatus]